MLALGILLTASTTLLPLHGHPIDPLVIVHHWDARRSAAYLADDPGRLRRLYAPGSAAGRTDLRTLAAYDRRGVRVTALTPQVLAVRVLSRDHASLRVRLRGRVAATGDDGHQCVRLPTSPISTRDLTLRRDATRWVMVAVRAAGPGAAAHSQARADAR